jgi:hypothetical protein
MVLAVRPHALVAILNDLARVEGEIFPYRGELVAVVVQEALKRTGGGCRGAGVGADGDP